MSSTMINDEFNQATVRHHAALLRSALVLTRDLSDAHDLVQDALERALREWARFTPGTNVRAWMMAILSRLFIDRWRKQRCRPRFVSLDGLDPPAEDDQQQERDTSWEAITPADLRRAATLLPQGLRRVFELSAFGRLSYAEISAMTGIRVTTVGTRLLRARRQLRALLRDQIAKPAHELPGIEFSPANAEGHPVVRPPRENCTAGVGVGL
jgi:RNA polymerase sigma-70 factor (ECF subfamily)